MSLNTCFDWFKKLRLFSYILNLKLVSKHKWSVKIWNFTATICQWIFIIKKGTCSKSRCRFDRYWHFPYYY